jgi:hypothetical protein
MAYEGDQVDAKKVRAAYVAKETGISEEQALSLIARIGMDLPALLREGRILARAG